MVALTMVVSMFGISNADTPGDYGDVTLTGGFQTGHFDDVWDLTDGDITISFTYDANGMVDDAGAHAWSELGVRSQSLPGDWNPNGEITVYAEESYDLIAAQSIDIGDVIVQRVVNTLYVTFAIVEDGWFMSETHLDVQDTLSEIPQTKTGNPVPGKFAFMMYYDPPVAEYRYEVDVSAYPATTTFYIAAHAAVLHVSEICFEVVSDGSVMWSGDELTWTSAVPCWVHPSWPGISGATWIWRTEYVDPEEEYSTVPDGGWWFEKAITLPLDAYDIVAEIQADADNGEAVYVNGNYILQDGSMDKDGPDLAEWSTIETADISEFLAPGENTLTLRALNFLDSGDEYSNPAGLVFKVAVCYNIVDEMESAWAGTEDFSGSNWATYMTYTPADPITIHGSGVWLATDYDWTTNTFDPDPVEAPTLDLDDKLILQRVGGHGEGDYNLPSAPPAPGNNHRVWWDRDGVDPYQNAATANTGGIYEIVIKLHATSDTTATAYMNIRGLDQGFETDGNWNTIELTPAGMTWTGDMHHLLVFYGLYGYGATHTAEFSDITVTQ